MGYRHQHLLQVFIFRDGRLGMVTVIVEALLRAIGLLRLTGFKWLSTRFAETQYILLIRTVAFVPSGSTGIRAEVIGRFDFSAAKQACPNKPRSRYAMSGKVGLDGVY